VLVVDNASGDGSREVAEHLLGGLPHARVVANPRDLGRIGNWNRCLELAQGKYLKFALANDVLLPGALAYLLAAAEAHSDAAMVCSRFQMVEAIPDALPAMEAPRTTTVRQPLETLRFFAERGCQTGGLNSMLINRELVTKAGLRFREDIPYCADYCFAIELARLGPSVFLDTASYLFNAGAKGRFHFAGQKDPRAFFLEQRECVVRLAGDLGDAGLAHTYMIGQYVWYLGQGASLKPWDAWDVFDHAPLAMRWRATWLTTRTWLRRRWCSKGKPV
jgi:GT2 family glycosyltransferase